ncbi:HAD family hydrolase [Olivibacter sp. SDN3]|uniref:HAD family hydrolase n=1 Tax=Olivibacter sp. SDN3 TaxID=2764720 RepID=UPI0016510C6C|nr:HAD family hydrolase [Olivibacter sp. SDN3]QNL49023.1 HAD family hydrolase [Olivibacter sp. SDN3]
MLDVQCVIFDCDGVLVDTETTMITVLLEMVAEFGVKINVDEGVSLFSGKKIEETIDVLKCSAQSPFPANFEQQFRLKAYERFKIEVKPIDGVERLIQLLKIPFCVASNGPREKVAFNLKLTGLWPYFNDDRIFSAYEVNTWKPDPGIFLHAARMMGFEPAQCVVIEDSLAGVEAAVNGGFQVLALTNGYNVGELSSAGVKVFGHMEELYPLLPMSKSN